MYFFGHCTRSTKQVFPRGFRKFSPQKKKKGLTFHYRVSISSGKINFGSRNFPPFEEGEFFSLVLLRITDLPSSDGRGKKRISNSAQQLFPPVQVESRNHPIVDEERGWRATFDKFVFSFPPRLRKSSARNSGIPRLELLAVYTKTLPLPRGRGRGRNCWSRKKEKPSRSTVNELPFPMLFRTKLFTYVFAPFGHSSGGRIVGSSTLL